jgi:hypothetical protein
VLSILGLAAYLHFSHVYVHKRKGISVQWRHVWCLRWKMAWRLGACLGCWTMHIARQIVCIDAALLQSCRGEMFGSEAAVAVLGNLYNVN